MDMTKGILNTTDKIDAALCYERLRTEFMINGWLFSPFICSVFTDERLRLESIRNLPTHCINKVPIGSKVSHQE